ncbi:ultra-long-chain fatty acid omega-hydroxylase-like [Diadema antillarum]|uniref:ultra-long-chain fatty acid omega-hydroxylase-like n=1 Tax=Diadema antillarum TaxID=105358 RepID=UPI003A864D06
MSFITTILGTVVLSFFGFKIVQFLLSLVANLRRLMYITRHLPGPKPHWLYGNARDPGFNEPGFKWEQEAVSKYRRLLVFWMGWKPVVMLNHPDSIKPLLATNIGRKGDEYRVFKDWTEGLGTLEGAIWKRHRSLITPSFHFQVLKQYLMVMNEALDVLIDKLHVAADQGEPVKTHETMSLLSHDVILRCAFSHQSNCQQKESREVEVFEKLTNICAYRMFNPLMFYDFIFRLSSKYREWKESYSYVHNVHDRIVAERRRVYATEKEPEKKTMDFLDTLLLARDSNGNGLSEKEIRDEVNMFIFAGTDTTASALTWLLYTLAQHPEEQARVQEEVDTLFAGRDDDSVRYEDLKKLTYTTQCLRESMRLYVNVPSFRVMRESLKVNGFTVPAGTNVMVNNYQVHHNPDVWGDDHMDFKPERFERANVEKRDPFAFVPFSAGARNCLGQQFAMDELRSAAARIFRKFSVSLVKGARPVFQIVTKPDNEILLKFSHR